MGITACLIWPSASWHSCSSRCHRHLGWDDLPLWTWNLRVKVENVHSDWELLWRHNLGDNHSWACWHHGNHPAVPADGQPGISKSGTWQFSKPFCTLLVSCLHLASCPRHGLDMAQILLKITRVCLQLFMSKLCCWLCSILSHTKCCCWSKCYPSVWCTLHTFECDIMVPAMCCMVGRVLQIILFCLGTCGA